MSELEYRMKCPNPNCKSHNFKNGLADYMFSGSGTKGECMSCDFKLNPKKSYRDFAGVVISYNG